MMMPAPPPGRPNAKHVSPDMGAATQHRASIMSCLRTNLNVEGVSIRDAELPFEPISGARRLGPNTAEVRGTYPMVCRSPISEDDTYPYGCMGDIQTIQSTSSVHSVQ